MKRLINNLKKYLRQFKKSIRLIYSASHKYFILYCVIMVIGTLLPYVPLWIMRSLLNSLADYWVSPVEAELQKITVFTILYCTYFLLKTIFDTVQKLVTYKYNDEIDYYFDNLLIDKIAKADMSFFDSSTLSDQMLNTTVNMRDTTQRMVFSLFGMLQGFIRLVISSILIGTLGLWMILVIVLLCIPSVIFTKKTNQRNYDFTKKHNIDQRKMSYYKGLFFGDARQEIRLYAVSEFFAEKYENCFTNFRTEKNKVNRKNFYSGTFSRLFVCAVEILAYITAISELVLKNIGVGDVTYYVSLVTNFRLYVTGIANKVNEYAQNSIKMDDILAFIDAEPAVEKGGELLPGRNPRIEFRHVTFRYPLAEENVLEDCSFVIEPDQFVGLVGFNGAGKSTIVKLLLRFYDPTEGQILLDGIDAKEYDLPALRKLFRVMFQDYYNYSMTLRENIAIADLSGIDNDERLYEACKKSRADGLIADFEHGLEENLTKRFDENGKELSGGGWQRIALSRTFFRKAPVTLLDEPSASLDPLAEDEIFGRYAELSDRGTTVLISHRLSNIVNCDKIIVLDGGRIIEQGSHEELLRLNGCYAKLFNLQANKYL